MIFWIFCFVTKNNSNLHTVGEWHLAASLASKKMRLTIEQRLKKNSSLLPSVTANNFGTFLESWRDPYFSRQTNCQYSVLLIFKSSRNLGKLNGHTVQMVMTNQWMPFIKRFPLWKKKTPVTNLGCEGTWHLYKLATNWTLVYGHLNLTPGWSFQSIFGHFWTNGHDWISRPGLYLMAGPRNSIRFTLSENPKEWIKNEVF